jgi:tRNA dimethylallyltransferase
MITIVIGPTAIGKSAYAIKLAQETGAEIISADAFQVYKYMDIGTAKVSEKEQSLVKHHLIDILEPNEPYSVANFLELSEAVISDLNSKNKPIIICGGTGFYINAFLYGFKFSKNLQIDKNLIANLTQESESIGKIEMWNRLKAIDSESAEIIDPGNVRRVIRALAIYEQTHEKPSSLRTEKGEPRKDVELLGLSAPRELINERINKRVDSMIELGLIDEIKNLLSQGFSPECQAFQALGYKEIISHLDNPTSNTITEVIELVKLRTRQFAKRQMTWFRKFDYVNWKNQH